MCKNYGPARSEKNRCREIEGDCQEMCPLHELIDRFEGRRPSGHTSLLEIEAKACAERRFFAWKKGVDRRLFEVALTTSVLREMPWRRAYNRGQCCRKAAEAALKRYRQGRVVDEEMTQKRRGRLLTLIQKGRRKKLEETARMCSESLLRDALRLAGPSQQDHLERILEEQVG